MDYSFEQAGFGFSEIDATKWQQILTSMRIADGVRTEKGWKWESLDGEGYVMTSNNPITGEHFWQGLSSNRTDSVGPVGVEGRSAFVTTFYNSFKASASYIDRENATKREFI